MEIQHFHSWFGETHILQDISVALWKNKINCIIGPSGSGKSTLIRSINRINEEVDGFVCKGTILLEGENIYRPQIDVHQLRKRIGMVFQKPCIFPKSISQNVLFGLEYFQKLSRLEKSQKVEENLKAVSLWKEVAHRLNHRATGLSLGQQQRLCIARALAVDPEILLLDEPTSSLDPLSTHAIEDLMVKLREKYTLVFVTHDILQARRIADQLIFVCNGQLIEAGPTERLFQNPQQEQTRDYLYREYCDC